MEKQDAVFTKLNLIFHWIILKLQDNFQYDL